VAPGDLVTFVSTAGGAAPRLTSWSFDPAAQGRVMRPGDSGGPVLRGAPDELGAVVAVGSGYVTSPCAGEAPDAMTFGDVAGAAPAIERAIAGWSATR
jgi:hypothetical protein